MSSEEQMIFDRAQCELGLVASDLGLSGCLLFQFSSCPLGHRPLGWLQSEKPKLQGSEPK